MAVVSSTTGVIVGITASLPSTYDATGYEALTFTAIGELIDIEPPGKMYSVVEHSPVAENYTKKIKDGYTVENVPMTIATKEDDAGQVIIAAALDAYTSRSIQILYPDGKAVYFTGQVVKSKLGKIGKETLNTLSVEVTVNPETLIEVAA